MREEVGRVRDRMWREWGKREGKREIDVRERLWGERVWGE